MSEEQRSNRAKSDGVTGRRATERQMDRATKRQSDGATKRRSDRANKRQSDRKRKQISDGVTKRQRNSKKTKISQLLNC